MATSTTSSQHVPPYGVVGTLNECEVWIDEKVKVEHNTLTVTESVATDLEGVYAVTITVASPGSSFLYFN